MIKVISLVSKAFCFMANLYLEDSVCYIEI